MDFITFLQNSLTEQLPQIIASYPGAVSAESLAAMETSIREMTQQLGGEILKQLLEAQTEKYPADECACPHCGANAIYERRREGTIITLLGRIRFRRPYYLCSHCGRGHYPLDEVLGIEPGQMSQEVRQMAALVAVHASFGKSSDLLYRLTRIELSPNSIRKATQQIGQQIVQREAALVEVSQDLEAQQAHKRVQQKPQQLYGSLDGFMSHIDDEWHEMKAGAWWITNGQHAEQIQYYTDFRPAADFSALTWATGFGRLADQAEVVIFIADGAEWIWRIVSEHFPQAVQIVDWYHAFSYVQTVAQAAFSDTAVRDDWIEQQRQALRHGRRSVVFRACRQLMDAAPDAVKRALTFFTNQRARMRYDRYRAAGYQIGSGTMESGCKQLGLGRLRIAGAQWSAQGARLVAKARAAYLSGEWDELTAPAAALPHVA